MAKKHAGTCAYCGVETDVETEHVVPLSLFDVSIRGDCDFALVDSCETCNRGFAKHEEEFTHFCVMASDGRPEAKSLFYGPMKRALDRPGHGLGSLDRIWKKMRESNELPGRHNIYADNQVFFILRKITRGLSAMHLGDVIPDSHVSVQKIEIPLPPDIDADEAYWAVHPNVFRYQGANSMEDKTVHSIWILKIFETIRYITTVHKHPVNQTAPPIS